MRLPIASVDTCSCIAATVLLAASQHARASISFSFTDPGAGPEIHYQAPESAGDLATMRYGQPDGSVQAVPFQIDGQFGFWEYEAVLVWDDWQVGPVTTSTAIDWAPVSGTFSFIELSSGESILDGGFSNGLLVFSAGAGAQLIASGSDLWYSGGPRFPIPFLLNLISLDSVYVLGDIQFSAAPLVERDGSTYFGSFTASAAFGGTAEYVIPSAAAAQAIVAFVVVRIRRRRRCV